MRRYGRIPQRLGIGKTHLIGYSLSGGVALHLAAKYPEMVRSITTIGCGGIADPTGADIRAYQKMIGRHY